MKQKLSINIGILFIFCAVLVSNFSFAQLYPQVKTNKERGWTLKRIVDGFRPYHTPNLMPIIAHRGYWRGDILNNYYSAGNERWYPENSIVSILNCHLNGIEAAELDIRLTSDKEPILVHDLTYGRTTSEDWDVMNHTGTNSVVDQTSWNDRPGHLRAWQAKSKYKVIGSNAVVQDPQADYGSFSKLVGTFGHIQPNLSAVLRFHKENDIRVLLFLEVFSTEALEILYKEVESADAFSFCVFKLGIGGGSEEGYFETLHKLGVMGKFEAANGNVNYWALEREATKPFLFTTINYEDSKKIVKEQFSEVRRLRNSWYNKNVIHVFQEIVAKTDVAKDTPDLYKVAADCRKRKIRVGGYWVIPFATVIKRGTGIDPNGNDTHYPPVAVDGHIGKKGSANVGWNGQNPLPAPGSCCTSAGNNTFQMDIDNVIKNFVPRVNKILSKGQMPEKSGMGANLVTSDEVEYMLENFPRSGADTYYKAK